MSTIYTLSSIPLRIPFAPNRRFNFTKPIRVTNITTKLTNYQIAINLNTTNFAFEKARSDGADIRFQDANGKALNYWIESWTSASAKIWIKLDELESYGNRIIWMIYGNHNIISESNGDKVFLFFDDFNDSSIDTNKWGAVENGTATEEAGVMKLSPSGASTPASLPSLSTFTNGIVETRTKVATSTSQDHLQLAARGSIVLTVRGDTLNDAYIHDGSFVDGPVVYEDLEAYTGIWHRFKMTLNESTVTGYIVNEQTDLDITLSGSTSVTAAGVIKIRAFKGTSFVSHYDWIFIRKYVSSTPIVEIL